MSQLAIRRYPDILKRMQIRTVTRSDLSDLTDTSSVNEVLTAAAHEDADQWRAIAKTRKVLDINNARGPDLDDLIKTYNEAILERRGPTYATGQVVLSRAVAGAAIGGAAGVEVKVPASTGQGSLSYYTTTDWSIGAGVLSSAPVPIQAAEKGSKYNVGPGAISAFGSQPSGVDSVTNTGALAPGRDQEQDDELRRRVVLYKKSLARGTPSSLLYAALGVEDTVSGKIVVYAAVVEDPWNPGYVILYIDDGAGTAESTTAIPADTMLAVAAGGEKDLYTTYKPIKEENPFHFFVGGVLKTRNVDYTLDSASGHWKVTQASYPTGLPMGTSVIGDYSYFTGLIAAVQKVVDGDPADRTNFPGYRAAGTVVRVMAPSVSWTSVEGVLVMKNGFDVATAITSVKNSIVNYINSLGIGEDVIVNEIRALAMEVPGVYDIQLTIPADNLIVLDTQIARTSLAALNIT
jgi:uncharacterized phage protein gp47/JayE